MKYFDCAAVMRYRHVCLVICVALFGYVLLLLCGIGMFGWLFFAVLRHWRVWLVICVVLFGYVLLLLCDIGVFGCVVFLLLFCCCCFLLFCGIGMVVWLCGLSGYFLLFCGICMFVPPWYSPPPGLLGVNKNTYLLAAMFVWLLVRSVLMWPWEFKEFINIQVLICLWVCLLRSFVGFVPFVLLFTYSL